MNALTAKAATRVFFPDYVTDVEFGDTLVEIGIDYDYEPGMDDVGPSMTDAGEPGYDPEAHIKEVYWRADSTTPFAPAEDTFRTLLLAALGDEDALSERLIADAEQC